MDLENITKQVVEVCSRAGTYIRERSVSGEKVELKMKGLHNYVTNVDVTAEKMLVKALKEIVPGSGILAEEGTGNDTEKMYRWIIDPLDGTTNFIHGIPFCAISVALEADGRILIGAIYDVLRKESFFAWAGGGAFLNNKSIRVTETPDLGDSLLAMGFPYEHQSGLDRYMMLFRDLVYESRGIRRLGSAALDLAYVACGRFDGFYEIGLNPWDVAAGIILVKEAGGRITDFTGGENYLYGGEIVASNGMIHTSILQYTKAHYG